MSGADQDRAAQMRRAFDAGFAQPVQSPQAETVAVLQIRVGNQPFVVALSQLSGLHRDRPVRPLPTTRGELLGVVVIRSSILPVFDLGRLLGVEAVAGAPRWLVVRQAEPRVCFAFHAFEGYARVEQGQLLEGRSEGRVLRIDGQPLPILDIESIAARIEQRTPSRGEG